MIYYWVEEEMMEASRRHICPCPCVFCPTDVVGMTAIAQFTGQKAKGGKMHCALLAQICARVCA